MEIFAVQINPDTASCIASLWSVMSRDEQQGLDLLDSPRFRLQYLISTILKRSLLSVFSRQTVPPHHWEFVTDTNGKPRLSKQTGDLNLHFNVSHCEGLFVIAIQTATPLGVDVEPLDSTIDDYLAKAVLTGRERLEIDHLGTREAQFQSMKLWTLKEAYVKLMGIGMKFDFRAIQFSAEAGDSPSLATTYVPDVRLYPCTLTFSDSGYLLAVAASKQLGPKDDVPIFHLSNAEDLRGCFHGTPPPSRKLPLRPQYRVERITCQAQYATGTFPA